MAFSSWIQWLKRAPGRDGRAHPYRQHKRTLTPRRSFVPGVLALEDRTLLNFTVINTFDDGNSGCLRWAINQANIAGGTIDFHISTADGGYHYDSSTGTFWWTIKPTSRLPTITSPVIIDGYSQTGYSGHPIVELNGSLSNPAADGLWINGGNSSFSTIRGLVINGWTNSDAIEINGSNNNHVEGNYLGTDVYGTASVANYYGIDVYGASNNTIAGNLISGNNLPDGTGILVWYRSSGNMIQGNYIGTDVSGRLPLGNARDGIEIINAGSNNTVGGTIAGAGNLISGNNDNGVLISDSTTGTVVQGNFIGTDYSGTLRVRNGGLGVALYSDGNTVGGTSPPPSNLISASGAGNLISGNAAGGVIIGYSMGNVVQGNWIGTDHTGMVPLGNNGPGVHIGYNSPSNTIGGTAPGAGNVISGNQTTGSGYGVVIEGDNTTGNLVQGNFIGTDYYGTVSLGNAVDGIVVTTANNRIGGTTGTVGPLGSAGFAGNLISGNQHDGVDIRSTGNLVQGNFIGTDVHGTAALGNTLDGVLITGASNNTIGGIAGGAGNLISGNHQDGVMITDNGSAGNLVQGNYIGTDVTGTARLANSSHGVFVRSGAHDNTIGGTAAGAANIIAFNQGAGVVIGANITDRLTIHNRIQANSIHDNAHLGIDLGDDGVSGNAANDAANHQGPNALMNFPVLAPASFSFGSTSESGILDTNTVNGPYPINTVITLDFYANSAPDSTGYGQGKTWLGFFQILADGNASMIFHATGLAPIPSGQPYLTATATEELAGNTSGNTSEFSAAVFQFVLPDSNTGGGRLKAMPPGPGPAGLLNPVYMFSDQAWFDAPYAPREPASSWAAWSDDSRLPILLGDLREEMTGPQNSWDPRDGNHREAIARLFAGFADQTDAPAADLIGELVAGFPNFALLQPAADVVSCQ
jgi:parallel beta-helix repeat protein